MNTQDFIKSGVLESYLLGFATEEEQHEVNQQMLTSSVFADHAIELGKQLQGYFLQNAVPPPPAVRELIGFRSGNADIQKADRHTYYDIPKEAEKKKNEYLDIEINDTHIKVHKWWRPAFIVVFVLSKVFLIAGLYYYFKADSQAKEIERLKTEIPSPGH